MNLKTILKNLQKTQIVVGVILDSDITLLTANHPRARKKYIVLDLSVEMNRP